MGDPKKRKRKYSRPRKAFQKENIEKGKNIKEIYGLKNKKEFYRAETTIRSKRATARKLLALDLETRIKKENELLESLKKIGILKQKPSLDDVLTLTVESLLERRLQTIVWRKGLANTPKQARQFITHGHISINGKKVDRPGYLVNAEEENNIKYYKKEMQINSKEHLKTTEKNKSEIKQKFEDIVENKEKDQEEKIVEKKDNNEEKIIEKKDNKEEKDKEEKK